MKELSIEEKASRYDEALKVANKYKDTHIMFPSIKDEIFPELKESEDEKIRKAIKKALQVRCDGSRIISDEPVTLEEALAWLEKQGKHAKFLSKIQVGDKVTRNKDGVLVNLSQLNRVAKPTDKVEPKFHEGEWITNGDYTWQIVSVTDLDYILQSQDGNTVDDTISHVDEQFHSFTIEDAKDGNVLHSPSHRIIWIYKDNEHYYGCVNMNYVTENTSANGQIVIPNDTCPATKDEQTILFAMLKEAGYEWDADKKELKKIEHKHFCELNNSYNCVKFPFKAIVKSSGAIVTIHGGRLSPDAKEWVEYQSDAEDGYKIYEPNSLELVCEIDQKTIWSEEDESNRRSALMLLRYPITIWSDVNNITRIKIIDWLKSLEDKYISQQKQDWSEKDEERRKKIIHILSLDGRIKNEELSDINDWLKSIRPQSHWKPNNEQMKAIEHICDGNYNVDLDILDSIYRDFKKLRKE